MNTNNDGDLINRQPHSHQEGQQNNKASTKVNADNNGANSRQVSDEEVSDEQKTGDDSNRQGERLVQQ